MTQISGGFSTRMPIEVAVQQAVEQVANDATTDLGQIVEQIDSNSKRKAQIRGLQKKVEVLKNMIRQGGDSKAKSGKIAKALKQLKASGAKLGLGGSEFSNILSKTPNKAKTQDKDTKDLWSDWMQSLDRVVDAESQGVSDISQKLQFQLTSANNIHNRYTKMRFDLNSKHSRTMDSLAGSIKG